MLFTADVFVAAALLFVVQTMVGKMVPPHPEGDPQVWNTSLLFFQVALLAGYLYTHVSVRGSGCSTRLSSMWPFSPSRFSSCPSRCPLRMR